MKTPASQLNGFIEKLAVWLKNNQPRFVTKYGVKVQHIPKGEYSIIRFITDFEISNSEIQKLESADLIEEVEA